MCELARGNSPTSTIVQADLAGANVPVKRSFTVITIVGVLSSILFETLRIRLLRNLWSLMTSGGTILIADFGTPGNNFYEERYRKCGYEPRTFVTREGLYIHHFTFAEINRLLKVAGFTVVQRDTLDVTTSHGNQIPGHMALAKRL
jgi:hypothetical protein